MVSGNTFAMMIGELISSSNHYWKNFLLQLVYLRTCSVRGYFCLFERADWRSSCHIHNFVSFSTSNPKPSLLVHYPQWIYNYMYVHITSPHPFSLTTSWWWGNVIPLLPSLMRETCLPYHPSLWFPYHSMRNVCFPLTCSVIVWFFLPTVLLNAYHFTFRFGPLVRFWVMRFEGKHNFFKDIANAFASMAETHQLYSCYLHNTHCSKIGKDTQTGPGEVIYMLCTTIDVVFFISVDESSIRAKLQWKFACSFSNEMSVNKSVYKLQNVLWSLWKNENH